MGPAKIWLMQGYPLPRKTEPNRIDVGGIGISHPNRVVYLEDDVTKLDLVRYYEAVGEQILPHMIDRPLSLLRVPGTIYGRPFFQRHLPKHSGPSNVSEVPVTIKTRTEYYMKVDDELGLLSLVQWGGIEFHTWGCRADNPFLPDRMIFDLDPDPEASWAAIVEGAGEIRDRMTQLGLQSFLKTTGGKGLHVVIPIERAFGWQAIKAFTRGIAESMEHDNPSRFISNSSKAKRKGKIFVDYLRNDLTATAVCAYAVRARRGAYVSTPLSWSELDAPLDLTSFNIRTLPAQLRTRKSDPWVDFFSVRQHLKPEYLEAL